MASAHAALTAPPFSQTLIPTSYPSAPLLPSSSFSSNNNTKPNSLSLHSSSPFPKCLPTPSIPLATTPGFVLLQQLVGVDEDELEGILDKHPQLELSPPGSLRRRILALQSAAITGLALRRTVARSPDVLTSPEIGPFLDFTTHHIPDLEPAKLERVLSSVHPHLLPGFIQRARLLLDRGIPGDKLGHVVNNLNIHRVFFERPLQELEETILFLERYRWPDLLLRRPALLSLDLQGQLIPRVEFLAELGGGDEEAVATLIAKLPAILSYSVDHYKSHLDFWRSAGLTGRQVFKIALVYPNIFSVSRERKLEPRVEFLMQCGLNSHEVFKFLIKAPLFLSLSYKENLAKKLGFLVKIGYEHRTRELALAMGAVTRTSCENMQNVIGVFFGYGLSCQDLLAMSKKHPQVLQYNHESLAKKMDFLIEGMEREIGELLVFPAFLGYKLDDRIKRRYEEKKEIRGKGLSLNKLLSVSTKRFNSNSSSSSNASDAETGCDLDSATVQV